MLKEEYIEKIKRVEKLASTSKMGRMLAHPLRYLDAILFRKITYKRTRKEKEAVCETFFGSTMHILLPSSTDIYLTGGKSHHSEIRLAKFLIQQLEPNDTFLDVGAHYGYFTLLASQLVGRDGVVRAFEASPTTFRMLNKNQTKHSNIKCNNLAVSDEDMELTFYEFPNLYSEYNSLDIDQFKDEAWFLDHSPKEIKIKSVILDQYLSSEGLSPAVIKIDVEGAEYKVISGLQQFVANHSPIIVLEYLSDARGNEEHKKAETLLRALDYRTYMIDADGGLIGVDSVADYLRREEVDSDNVVFKKG